MPSGRGARASVSSSDAERSSYRTTFIGPSATGGSAGLDAVAEDVALGFFGRAHLLVEVVEVRQRLPDDARLDQLADLVAVQRVDGALLLDQLRHRAREVEVIGDGQDASVESGQQLGVVKPVEREVQVSNEEEEHVRERELRR